MATEAPRLAEHGGDLEAVARRYGVPATGLIDFSANVNPLGPPESLLAALQAAVADRTALARYPQPDAADLRAALAAHLDVDPAAIVVANGAAALIDVAVRVARMRRCLVPVPAFSEYRRALDAAGIELVALALDPAADFALPIPSLVAAFASGRSEHYGSLDGCIVTNPHNPSGALSAGSDIEQLVAAAGAAGVTTIVDEAFIDYVPVHSVAALAAVTPGAIVIRSLTKFFATPALRVGYAVCEPALAERLRHALPSWPVTTAASQAFIAALSDIDYAQHTRAANAQARTRLVHALQSAGMRVFPAAANFVLIALPPSAPAASVITGALIESAGIVVRDCSSYCGLAVGRYIRVAVRNDADNMRFVTALERSCNQAANGHTRCGLYNIDG